MINHERIGEFLIELIRYADDNDIKTFLNNCSPKLLDNTDTCSYKTLLINYLFEYIYGFIEPKLPTLPELGIENGKIIRGLPISKYANFKTDISNYTNVYLHIYALCENYYSYIMLDNNERKILQQSAELISEDVKLNVITDKDRTKILKLLIESYADNKFYYYFYNDKLIRLKIVQKQKEHKLEYCYESANYKLEDKYNTTYIISPAHNVNIALKQKLVRTRDCVGAIDYEHIEEYLKQFFENINFQDIKTIHKEIISAITPKKNEYCKCCNPNLKNPNSTKICDNCRNLLFELKQLNKTIDKDDINDYIASIKSIDFKKFIYSINDKDIGKLRTRRRTEISKIINKLQKEVSQELKENFGSADEKYYTELTKRISKIKDCIIQSYNNE